MKITHEHRTTSYGMIDYVTVENSHGLIVTFTSLGAAIHRIIFHGQDLAVTPYDLEDFLSSKNYYGKTVGRTAGRIFSPSYRIDDQTYPVTPFGASQSKLHGGAKGFSFQPFQMLPPIVSDEAIDLTFRYVSPHGEEDYPGEVSLDVTYRVTATNAISLTHTATTTMDTLINITNHVYFNLDIPHKVLDHTLLIDADKIVDINADHSVNGLLPVAGTPYDFKTHKRLGKAIDEVFDSVFKGFDHCWILNQPTLDHLAMEIIDPASKRRIKVYTDYPAVVVYTHNLPTPSHLEMFEGKSVYRGLTVECQYEPGGIHHRDLNSAIVRPNETYHHHVRFVFEEGR